MERIPVSSSVIASVGHDPATQLLEVEFTSGLMYRYLDVPCDVFDDLLAADSLGAYFNEHIRDSYPQSRI